MALGTPQCTPVFSHCRMNDACVSVKLSIFCESTESFGVNLVWNCRNFALERFNNPPCHGRTNGHPSGSPARASVIIGVVRRNLSQDGATIKARRPQACFVIQYLWRIPFGSGLANPFEQVRRRFGQTSWLSNIPPVRRTHPVRSIREWQRPTDIVDCFIAPILRRLNSENLTVIPPQLQAKEGQVIYSAYTSAIQHRIEPFGTPIGQAPSLTPPVALRTPSFAAGLGKGRHIQPTCIPNSARSKGSRRYFYANQRALMIPRIQILHAPRPPVLSIMRHRPRPEKPE